MYVDIYIYINIYMYTCYMDIYVYAYIYICTYGCNNISVHVVLHLHDIETYICI